MSQQQWFWDVLGIEPTNDKTVIKQAFSKLARENNPEEHPEEYAKLHEAYKAALDYASDKQTGLSNVAPASNQNDPEFDFSSVDTDDRLSDIDVTMLENAIHEYKKAFGLYSYEFLFNRPKDVLRNFAVSLFNLYTDLSTKTGDVSVWNRFFAEPLICLLMDDESFRKMLTDKFIDDDTNRTAVSEFIDNYERDVIQERNTHNAAMEAKRLALHKKSLNWLYIAAGVVIGAVIFCVTGYYTGFSILNLITVGLITTSFALCCVSYYDEYHDWYENTDKNSLFKVLCILFGILSWMFVLSDNHPESAYWFTTLLIVFILSVIIILMIIIGDAFMQGELKGSNTRRGVFRN